MEKKMMNTSSHEAPSPENTQTIQDSNSIFEKFKTVIHKANIPFSVL